MFQRFFLKKMAYSQFQILFTAMFCIAISFLVRINLGLCEDLSPFEVLETPSLILFYPVELKHVLPEIVQSFESSESHLSNIFHWVAEKKIQLVVMNNRKQFLKMAEHSLTVAFAETSHYRIVIDYTQVFNHPFSLQTTLQHELCHILIQQHLSIRIPRWLNEGIAQWASEGIAEIIHSETNLLQHAAFSGNLIPFYKLSYSFPMDATDFILAYEQSKSFVTYIVNTYGKNNILLLLDQTKKLKSINDAVRFVYGKSIKELEQEWTASITHYLFWFVYISNNMYTFIFIGMAFLCILGFIRMKAKKHNYPDDWDDDFEPFE